MKVTKIELLPTDYKCKLCSLTKPTAEMIVVRLRSQNAYMLRPRCKACHNGRERGYRREWKKKYLQKWRKKNTALSESYWRNDAAKERCRKTSYKRFNEKHDAILIQGRMRRHGFPIGIAEAEELLKKFGRCYPTRFGLTPKGLRECERIRSAIRRRRKKRISNFEIRLMVYDDEKSNYIKPKLQPKPYQSAASTLRKWHQENKKVAEL